MVIPWEFAVTTEGSPLLLCAVMGFLMARVYCISLIRNQLEQLPLGDQAGDYAIIPISGSSFTITNKVGNPNNENEQFAITTSISRAATGTKVLRYGKYSGITEGTVSSAYCDVTYKNNDKTTTYVTNLVKVDLKYGEAISGDSGGPVFTATGSFCGVHSGSDETGKVTTYFSPTQYLSTSSFSCAVG